MPKWRLLSYPTTPTSRSANGDAGRSGSTMSRVCADGAIDDGHMRPGDFEWWTPVRPRDAL